MTADGEGDSGTVKEDLNAILKEIILFPGSKKEFEETYGYETEVVDLKTIGGGLYFMLTNERLEHYENPFNKLYENQLLNKIVDEGIVALINSVSFGNDWPTDCLNDYKLIFLKNVFYGIPVKRKVDNDKPLHITGVKP